MKNIVSCLFFIVFSWSVKAEHPAPSAPPIGAEDWYGQSAEPSAPEYNPDDQRCIQEDDFYENVTPIPVPVSEDELSTSEEDYAKDHDQEDQNRLYREKRESIRIKAHELAEEYYDQFIQNEGSDLIKKNSLVSGIKKGYFEYEVSTQKSSDILHGSKAGAQASEELGVDLISGQIKVVANKEAHEAAINRHIQAVDNHGILDSEITNVSGMNKILVQRHIVEKVTWDVELKELDKNTPKVIKKIIADSIGKRFDSCSLVNDTSYWENYRDIIKDSHYLSFISTDDVRRYNSLSCLMKRSRTVRKYYDSLDAEEQRVFKDDFTQEMNEAIEQRFNLWLDGRVDWDSFEQGKTVARMIGKFDAVRQGIRSSVKENIGRLAGELSQSFYKNEYKERFEYHLDKINRESRVTFDLEFDYDPETLPLVNLKGTITNFGGVEFSDTRPFNNIKGKKFHWSSEPMEPVAAHSRKHVNIPGHIVLQSDFKVDELVEMSVPLSGFNSKIKAIRFSFYDLMNVLKNTMGQEQKNIQNIVVNSIIDEWHSSIGWFNGNTYLDGQDSRLHQLVDFVEKVKPEYDFYSAIKHKKRSYTWFYRGKNKNFLNILNKIAGEEEQLVEYQPQQKYRWYNPMVLFGR